MVIILAGSRLEYERKCRAMGLVDKINAIYGSHEVRMAGVEATEVVTTGSFWTLVDAGNLLAFARSRVRKPEQV